MKQLRIVIAEDEALVLGNFKRKLEKMGNIVVGTACDGLTAEKKIKELGPDLVIMDINMPKKNGLSVIESNCLNPLIPSIIITGHYSDELIRKADNNSIFAYLMKPVEENQLEAAVNVAWRKYEAYMAENIKSRKLEESLEDRKYIERAKGILMDRFSLKEKDAMIKLQTMSKNRNKKLALVAKEIIHANEILDIE